MQIDEVVRRKDIDPSLMFKCIFIMGSPGSGKSTFAEDYLGLPKEFVVADLDKVMSTLKIRDYNEQTTKRGWSLLNRKIRRHWAAQGVFKNAPAWWLGTITDSDKWWFEFSFAIRFGDLFVLGFRNGWKLLPFSLTDIDQKTSVQPQLDYLLGSLYVQIV